MSIHIRVVQRDRDLEQVWNLWRTTLKAPEAPPSIPRESKEGPAAILVTDGERPIGAVRLSRGDGSSTPSLAHPDLLALTPFLPNGQKVAVVDQVVLDERYQVRSSIVFAMVKVVVQVVKQWGCEQLVFFSPASLAREIAYVGLSPAGSRDRAQQDVVVLHAPLSALKPQFLGELAGPHLDLGPFFHRVIYIQGDVIFNEGDPGDKAYLVARGSVTVTAKRSVSENHEEEALIDILGPGELFGELALLDDSPRMATVRAYAGETDLWVIEAERFNRILDEDPTSIRPILRLLAARLRKSTRRAIALTPDDAGPEFLRLLLDVARATGLRQAGMIPGLTPEWVAGQVGRLPDTVLEMSRVLERRGLITWSLEGLWVHDLKGLETAWSGRGTKENLGKDAGNRKREWY